mgnify:CR=1 FL=1
MFFLNINYLIRIIRVYNGDKLLNYQCSDNSNILKFNTGWKLNASIDVNNEVDCVLSLSYDTNYYSNAKFKYVYFGTNGDLIGTNVITSYRAAYGALYKISDGGIESIKSVGVNISELSNSPHPIYKESEQTQKKYTLYFRKPSDSNDILDDLYAMVYECDNKLYLGVRHANSNDTKVQDVCLGDKEGNWDIEGCMYTDCDVYSDRISLEIGVYNGLKFDTFTCNYKGKNSNETFCDIDADENKDNDTKTWHKSTFYTVSEDETEFKNQTIQYISQDTFNLGNKGYKIEEYNWQHTLKISNPSYFQYSFDKEIYNCDIEKNSNAFVTAAGNFDGNEEGKKSQYAIMYYSPSDFSYYLGIREGFNDTLQHNDMKIGTIADFGGGADSAEDMMSKMKLIEDDIKGAAVDKSI